MKKRGVRRCKQEGARVRSKVFTGLLASFLLMLLIPAALVFVDFFRYQKILKSETLQYQHSLLEQVQRALDERLENICLVAIDISMDSEVNRFMDSDGMTGGELNVSAYRMMTLLNSYRQIYRSMSDILLYSTHYGRVITTQNSYSGAIAEYALLDDPALNRQLVAYFDEQRLYCQFVNLRPGSAQTDTLFLLQSVPLWSTGRDGTGVIAIQVDVADLLADIGGISGLQGGVVALLDETGGCVTFSGDTSLLALAQDGAAGAGESGWVNGPDGTYMVNRTAARRKGWQYVSVQPEQTYMSKLQEVRNTQILLVCAIVLVGAAAAYLLSRRNYTPLERIMGKMQREFAAGARRGGETEYEFIESSLGSMTRYMKTLQDTLAQEVPRIQENMLYQLLTGAVADYEAYRKGLAELGVLMPYPAFVVVVLDIAGYPSGRLEEREMFKLLLRQQLGRCLPPDVSWAAADIGQDSVALLVNGRGEALVDMVAAAMEQLCAGARAELLLRLTACVSEAVDGLEPVTGAYYGVRRLRDRCRSADETGVWLARENREQDKRCSCPEELKLHLANLVSVGQEEPALDMLEKSYRVNFDGRSVDLSMARSYFITLVDAALRGLPTQEERFDAFWAAHNPVPALTNGQTPTEMQALTREFVGQACRYVQSGRKSHADALKTAVLAYVEEHHADNGLSLSSVAEQFSITPNYLSAFFRENVGDTFLNCLTGVRVAHAKRLLRETTATLAEIAHSVGYTNSNALIRNYKKVERLTPGEYRDAVRGRK